YDKLWLRLLGSSSVYRARAAETPVPPATSSGRTVISAVYTAAKGVAAIEISWNCGLDRMINEAQGCRPTRSEMPKFTATKFKLADARAGLTKITFYDVAGVAFEIELPTIAIIGLDHGLRLRAKQATVPVAQL